MNSSARDVFLQLLVAKQGLLSSGQSAHRALREKARRKVWLSSGRARNGAEEFTLLFRGSEQRLGELEALLFDASARQRREVKQAAAAEADLFVESALPWQCSQGDTHIVQSWLDAVCTPVDAEHYLNKAINDGVRRTLKRASQTGYRKSVSGDKTDAAYFYRELFEPMAHARFGSMVSYGSLDVFLSMTGRTQRTEVAFLERDGERIAGMALVISPPRRTLRVWAYGIRRDLLGDGRLRAELMALLNGEAVRSAAQLGYELNLGLTRPYVDDGVLVYKKRWGAKLVPSDATRFALRFASPENQRRFLQAAPLLEIHADGVRAIPLAAAPLRHPRVDAPRYHKRSDCAAR